MMATNSMTIEMNQMGRQPTALKTTGAAKKAMMVPTGTHCDQMPITRPCLLSGNSRGMMLGQTTHIMP